MTSKETKKKKKAPAGWLNKEGSFNEAIFIAALLGFGSIILAFVAFTRPVKTPVLESYIYQHETDFFYTGEADPDIYDLTTIQPGEPIFRSVTDRFDVALTYTFNSAYEHELTGYYQLYMLIGDESGWSRKLMLLDAQTFAEDGFTAEATVDINEIQAIIDRYELASGISHTAYQVSVIADTTVEGTLNGSPLDDHITASMDFLMDEQHLYLRDRNDEDSGLTDIIVEAIDVTAQKPNMLKILNISVPVLAARIISFIGIILFGGLFVFVLFRAEQASKEDIAAHNRMVYGRWIVDVMTPEAIIDAETTILVDNMEDLVKIAERLDTMILHTIRDETHHYVINAGSMRYLLVIEEPNQAIGSENSGADSSSGRGA